MRNLVSSLFSTKSVLKLNQTANSWLHQYKKTEKSQVIKTLELILDIRPKIRTSKEFDDLVNSIQKNWQGIEEEKVKEYLKTLNRLGFPVEEAQMVVSAIFRLAQHSGFGKYFQNKQTNSIKIIKETIVHAQNFDNYQSSGSLHGIETFSQLYPVSPSKNLETYQHISNIQDKEVNLAEKKLLDSPVLKENIQQ